MTLIICPAKVCDYNVDGQCVAPEIEMINVDIDLEETTICKSFEWGGL